MTDDVRDGWKVWTHDWRSPVRGGAPVWDGTLPYTTPRVALDTSPAACGHGGWHYTRDLAPAVRLAGLWPDGWAARLTRVQGADDAIERGDKRRASSLIVVRHATDAEILTALGAPFGAHAVATAREQFAWWRALARPRHDPAEVEAQLALACSARGLPWSLCSYASAWAVRAAWDAWTAGAAGAARAAGAAWDAWTAGAAWAAWDAWTAGDAGAAGAAWAVRAAGAAGAAGDAGAAGAARAALTIYYARLALGVAGEPDQYAIGLRDAYAHGLALAFPVGPATLGWAMVAR